jgi:hypothetical protein
MNFNIEKGSKTAKDGFKNEIISLKSPPSLEEGLGGGTRQKQLL